MALKMNGMRLPALPRGKSSVHVFGDFLGYLFRCTRSFIIDTHANGGAMWRAVENDLHELGVRTVVIPRKGKPGKARQAREHRPAFRRTVKWRTGSEARISTLKRQYGWDRTRLDDLEGARIWTGQAVLAHNLVKIGALAG